MTSILQTATSAVKNEIAFNSLCRETAKNNLSLACNYVKSTLTGVLACADSSRKITKPIDLKDRCINFIKASLLALRAPLLYLPLINRVTQLALRFLSPPLSIDLINSLSFKANEIKARYSKETCCKVVEDHFRKKIEIKEKIAKSDLDLSKEEEAAFINKLGFTLQECNDIFLKFLAQQTKIQCSLNLKKEVNLHKKGLN